MRYWQRKRQNDIMCLPFNMNLYRHKRGISSQQMTDRHGTASGREIRLECGWGRETGGKGKFSFFALNML